jgi:uroporphyrinogen decarboxylase
MTRVLRRQEPDRVPIGYQANRGIDARLKAHFGLAPDDYEGLRRALQVDVRGVHVPYIGPRLHAELPERNVCAQWGIRTRYIEHGSGGYWDFCDFPLAQADEAAIDAWPMPSPDDYDYSVVAARCAAHADFALFTGGADIGDIMNGCGMLFGADVILMNLAMEHAPTLRFVDRRLAVQLEVLRRTLAAADGRIDFLIIGEDLGTQRGPLIGLPMFRQILRPRLQRLVDVAASYRIPVMIHSCGSSSWAFDDFIAMGIACVDTLQPEAANMSPAYLKQTFGDRLAFHGAISTAGVVATGTPDDVEEEVRATLRVYMPGGGYGLAPTHALQDNSPTENVVRMYQTAQRYGWYE